MSEQPQELQEYDVILNGVPTTVQLTPEDYESQGWVPAKGGGAARQPTKDEKAKRMAEQEQSKLMQSQKSRTPPNKAREYEGGNK
jgi:hypothetical protein